MFRKVKEIKSKAGELHFRRWSILSTPWFNIYLHCIHKKDDDKHMHDHPWSFYSIILKGAYVEERGVRGFVQSTKTIVRWPGSIQYVKKDIPHRITHIINNRPVWSLIITGKSGREWGYTTEQGWLDNKTYRENKRNNTL